MTMTTTSRVSGKPIRLWPGVVIVTVQWLTWFVLPVVVPEAILISALGGVAGGLAIVLWWLFFSRARWSERIGAIVLMAVAVVATRLVVHRSIENGMMGMMPFFFPIPGLCLALVAGAAIGRRLSTGSRRAVIAGAILLGSGVWTLARTDGIYGGRAQLHWRWTPTAEERLLARAADEPVAPASTPAAAPAPTPVAAPSTTPAAGDSGRGSKPGDKVATAAPPRAPSQPAEWPGFRGPNRDGVVRGVHIDTDWALSPPVQMWRRPIGPGWSSFSVRGDRLYTQEQRGEDEIVACYRVSTGEPVWRHRDHVRFWESNGGAGPRSTPTLSNGRVYTFGATGIVNVLDEATGSVVWSRNAATDAKRQVPEWGFASSPLVVDDVVIVAVSGTLVGYDSATGQPRWFGPAHGGSYSSPQLFTIDGVAQIVLLHGAGATGVAPATGALLWEYAWPGSAIVQPALTADGDLVINSIGGTGGVGTRRLSLTHGPGGWKVEERWTSSGLKPYFNDFVMHKGFAFGFDGSILSCIDLTDGTRKWKGGRYGNGQLVLLADQDLLLVTSEDGELALVKATPDQFTELARFQAMDSKTWNHPVLVGDVLLVRNGEEMAAFRLKIAAPPQPAVSAAIAPNGDRRAGRMTEATPASPRQIAR